MILLNRNVPTFIVPKDEEGMELLYQNIDSEKDYLLFSIDNNDLELLFQDGFCESLNTQFGILLDKQEEENICGTPNLKRLKTIVDAYLSRAERGELIFCYTKIEYLVTKAIAFETGIFFYF